MTTYNWKGFLAQWSKDVIASSKYEQALPSEVRTSGWLGYPGATEAQIAQAEARLKTMLPPSYREFLKVTNGWRMTGTYVDKLWSVEEIEWLVVRHPDWIERWAEDLVMMQGYLEQVHGESEPNFMQSEGQELCWMRADHLRSALEISNFGGSAIYLLNPQVVTSEGEWEAWLFTTWEEGDARHCSFWEMMQAEYQRLLKLLHLEDYRAKRGLPNDDLQMLVVKLPGLIEALQDKIEQYRSLPQHQQGVIEGLQFAEIRVREIQTQARDPQELHKYLSALASELERQARQGMQAAMQAAIKDFALGRIPSGGMGEIERQLRLSAKSEGYGQAACIIRWFLNDWTFDKLILSRR